MKTLIIALFFFVASQSFAVVQNCNEKEMLRAVTDELKEKMTTAPGVFDQNDRFMTQLLWPSDIYPITQVSAAFFIPRGTTSDVYEIYVKNVSRYSKLFITAPKITSVTDANGSTVKKICSANWADDQGNSDASQLLVIINEESGFIFHEPNIPVFSLSQEMPLN